MAKIVKRMARTAKTVAEGDIIFNPAVGSLILPPEYPFNGTVSIEVGDHFLNMSLAEFDVFAAKVAAIKKLRVG